MPGRGETRSFRPLTPGVKDEANGPNGGAAGAAAPGALRGRADDVAFGAADPPSRAAGRPARPARRGGGRRRQDGAPQRLPRQGRPDRLLADALTALPGVPRPRAVARTAL